MKYVYTAIFNPEDNNAGAYNVSFPDIPGCLTFGTSLEDAIKMAEDALCLWLYDEETGGKAIPKASAPNEVKTKGNDFITAIAVNTDYYKRYYENKSVKKTLTLPSWLNQRAEDANINFSKILQRALKEELEIAE